MLIRILILCLVSFSAFAEVREIGIELRADTNTDESTFHGMCRKMATDEFTEIGTSPSSVAVVRGVYLVDRGTTVYCTMDASKVGADPERVRSTELVQWTRPADDHYRINTGGEAFTDSNGNVWDKDGGFGRGQAAFADTIQIAGTVDDFLFQSERWLPAGADVLPYRFAVDNGTYIIKLYFAERGNRAVGGRIFDVEIEGTIVLKDFDIVAAAGAPRTLVTREFTRTITDGYINIKFLRGIIQNPMINAIEIIPVAPLVPPSQLQLIFQ